MPRDTNTQNAKKKINNTRGDLGETLKSDENKCITRKLDKMFFKWDDIIEKHSDKQNKFVLKKNSKRSMNGQLISTMTFYLCRSETVCIAINQQFTFRRPLVTLIAILLLLLSFLFNNFNYVWSIISNQ